MAINPCPCGPSLRLGTQIIAALYLARAILLLLLGLILLIISVTAIAVVAQAVTDEKENDAGATPTEIPPEIPAAILGIAGIGLFIFISVVGGFSLALAILLCFGIAKRSVSYLKIWVYITLVLSGLSVLGLVRELITGSDLIIALITGGLIVFDLYASWVAYAYTSELRRIRLVQLQTQLTVKQAA